MKSSSPARRDVREADAGASAGPETLVPALAAAPPGQLWLLASPFRLLEVERRLLPRLALRGRVHVIVGGHRYDVDGVLRGLRMLTSRPEGLRGNVRQRRAPTSFQMRALLKNTPATDEPLIILNFLLHYCSEEETLWKSRFLLEDSLDELDRLCQRAPVLVTARPPPAEAPPGSLQLYELLCGRMDRVLSILPAPPPHQLPLF